MVKQQTLTGESFENYLLKETTDLGLKEKISFYENPDYCFHVREKDKEIMERALINLAK